MNFFRKLRILVDPGRQAPALTKHEELILELREVQRQLDNVQSCFAMESDDDLLDAAIYQREALEARYRYLLRMAKESHATTRELPILVENKVRQIN